MLALSFPSNSEGPFNKSREVIGKPGSHGLLRARNSSAGNSGPFPPVCKSGSIVGANNANTALATGCAAVSRRRALAGSRHLNVAAAMEAQGRLQGRDRGSSQGIAGGALPLLILLALVFCCMIAAAAASWL